MKKRVIFNEKVFISFIFYDIIIGYMTQLAPVILEAHENQQEEQVFIDKIDERIVQNKDEKYEIDLVKVKEPVRITNSQQEQGAEIENYAVITMGAVITALLTAGLVAVVNLIFQVGIFAACKTKALDMYRLWARTNNYGAYLF